MTESFRKFYENIRPLILEEGRKDRYFEMFNPLLQKIHPDMMEEYTGIVKREIKNAIDLLKREDRIVWWLRLVRQSIFRGIKASVYLDKFEDNNEGIESLKGILDLLKKYDDKFFYITDEVVNDIIGIKENLKHFFSMGIDEIDNFTFKYQKPSEIFERFKDYEDKWREELGEDAQIIEITEELEDGDVEILKEFDDGYAWLDLKRQYCSDEGDAMGHCGNFANYYETRSVLSLRKLKRKNGRVYSTPHLTFIHLKDGNLGEMKGRANEKPSDKYHDKIISLLLMKNGVDWFIDGITGGGYMPDENFRVSDLSEDKAEKLFSKRPELATLFWLYENKGSDEVVEKLTKDGYTDFILEGGIISLPFARDYEDLIEDNLDSNKNLKKYLPYINGDQYYEIHHHGDLEYEKVDFMNSLDEDQKNQIKEFLIEKYGYDENDEEYDDMLDFIEQNDVDEIIISMDTAYERGVESGAQSELFDFFESGIESLEFTFELFGCGVSLNGSVYYKTSENDETFFDKIMYLEFPLSEFSKAYDSVYPNNGYMTIETEDDEDVTIEGDMSVPYYGFSGYDEGYANDAFVKELYENGVLT